ncbi:MAG: hypothetical protein J6B79_00565 [Clostridia bacterium]|nr:hypothetical protein [Clostridia bacterium]
MSKFKLVIKIILLVLAVALIVGIIYACTPDRIDDYSVEEHMVRIEKELQERYPERKYTAGGVKVSFGDYEIFPVYSTIGKIRFFLIELQPYGFIMVKCSEKNSRLVSWLTNNSMYFFSDVIGGDYYKWSPYIKDPSKNQPKPDVDKQWILDKNGERIYYRESPYYVTGNINEKKYLIELKSNEYIFAIKKDGEFINLISGEKIDLNDDEENLRKTQATMNIVFGTKHYI